ncbi:disease resistance RPP13-like protein 1 [Pyrus ussuriensis x Pyrus communis]|uniref:Disease resistance RPP13-like protein 1 n=1 Tax=Pyrus ussuriensis x Pyrus communis TaxID=2448454 RepID=A0A5N5HHW3_9ROSA|nr:disease resistance RPP13-like protein 1 [Pyrus ussuriensis x Pyrus communis]
MGVGRGSRTFTVPLPPQPSLLSVSPPSTSSVGFYDHLLTLFYRPENLLLSDTHLHLSLHNWNWIYGCWEFVGRTVGVGWWWVFAVYEVVRWCELIKGWG